MRIGIIGKGNVGSALAAGLSGRGHEIKFARSHPKESPSHPGQDRIKSGLKSSQPPVSCRR